MLDHCGPDNEPLLCKHLPQSINLCLFSGQLDFEQVPFLFNLIQRRLQLGNAISTFLAIPTGGNVVSLSFDGNFVLFADRICVLGRWVDKFALRASMEWIWM